MNYESEQSLIRGLEWLLAQQATDGGWHSKTYGQLKDGASVTALALHAIAGCPAALREKHAAAIDRGFAFLNRGIAKRGAVASPDGSLDFPTYASALWLTSLAPLRREVHAESQTKVIEYLLGAQIAEPRGFETISPSYGGWDFLGPDDAQGITTGTNISVTRYVLEALASARRQQASGGRQQASGGRQPPEATDAAIARGRDYVLRCQQADGGFAFTCEPASLSNKAAYSDRELTKPRSYGTATCDGILALLACGMKPADEPVSKAIAWLAKRPSLEVVPGFDGLPPEDGWDRGLRFYYFAALSSVLASSPLSERSARQKALAAHLVSLQKQDGRWQNESDRMRENDPLIATSLALQGMGSF
jgi:hypothetical protein